MSQKATSRLFFVLVVLLIILFAIVNLDTQVMLAQEETEELSPELIIGTDDRVRVANTTVYPYSAVVRVRSRVPDTNVIGICTGWVYDVDIVITAAHCLFGKHNGIPMYRTDVSVSAGQSGDFLPFGTCKAKRISVPIEWINGVSNAQGSGYDIGALWIDCPLGLKTGILKVLYNNDMDWLGKGTHVVSYGPGNIQMESYGKITRTETDHFRYDNDTGGGDSGAPVFVNSPDCRGCVIAVHNGGVSSGGQPIANFGRRMNGSLSFFLNNIQIQRLYLAQVRKS